MHTTIDKYVLRDKLKKNKETHEREFTEVWSDFIAKVIKETEVFLAEIKESTSPQKDRFYLSWTKPENHSADYEQALQMLEFHTGDTLTLGPEDFQKLVLDNWDWKHIFETSKAMYSGR